jgi:hypothetical protein
MIVNIVVFWKKMKVYSSTKEGLCVISIAALDTRTQMCVALLCIVQLVKTLVMYFKLISLEKSLLVTPFHTYLFMLLHFHSCHDNPERSMAS